MVSSVGQESRQRRLGLRGKAILLATALGVIPVVLVGSIAYWLSSQVSTRQVSEVQESEVIQIADKSSRFMVERFGNIQDFANNTAFLLNRIPPSEADQRQALLVDQLSNYLFSYLVYDAVALVDLQGEVIAQSRGSLLLPNQRETPYFQTVLDTGQPTLSDPLSQPSGSRAIFAAAPVQDLGGQRIAVIVGRLPVQALASDVLRVESLKPAQTYRLVDSQGQVFETRSAAESAPEVGQPLDQLIPSLEDLPPLRNPLSWLATSPSGSRQLHAYAPLSPVGNLDWAVVTSVDAPIAFALQRQFLITLVLGAGMTAVIVAILATVIANRGTRPVVAAATAVERIGQGDLQVAVPVQGQDEIAVLGRNINQMAARLAQLLTELRENSQQLAQKNQQIEAESSILQSDVGHLLDVVSEVEEGNLKVGAQVNERATGLVADTFNRLIERLAQVLTQVLTTAEQVSQTSVQLRSLAQGVADNSDHQSQGVSRVLALTEQVDQAAQRSATLVEQTTQALATTQTAVEGGRTAIQTMTAEIDLLQDSSHRIVQRTKALGEFVGLAEQFVQDQGQIASLTQVLALNATLVAARAAEQRDPHQFGVVAQEFEAIANQVSTLAQQTYDALMTLQQRTSQIQSVVFGVDTDIQALARLVEGFAQGVNSSEQAFAEVQGATREIVRLGEVVAGSSQEILTSTQQTTAALREVSVLAEQTAQITQTVRIQSEQMEHLSEQLLEVTRFFQLPCPAPLPLLNTGPPQPIPDPSEVMS